MMATRGRKELTQEDVLNRYPRLVSHLICESLGYFTPLTAANAILAYRENVPFWCEWYMDGAVAIARAEGRKATDDDVLAIGRDVIRGAVSRRHTHRGFMGDYDTARAIVERARKGKHPVLMSWG